MKRKITLLSLLFYATLAQAQYQPEHQATLWYTEPAATTGAGNTWMEYALPIGNGQLGASISGGIHTDEIQFNEKTLWQGNDKIVKEADADFGRYMNFGSVYVRNLNALDQWAEESPESGYVRYLDLEDGIAGMDFHPEDQSGISARYLASWPDEVIAVRYKADEAASLDLHFSMVPGKKMNASEVSYTDDYARFHGKMMVISYEAGLKIVPTGAAATLSTDETGITVRHADEVLLLLSGATDFCTTSPSHIFAKDCPEAGRANGSGVCAASLPGLIRQRTEDAATKGWEVLCQDHIRDFNTWSKRTSLQLGTAQNRIPTDELVRHYNNPEINADGKGNDALFLEQLYFAYGRYLEISSSRGVDLPSNLQGIWCNDENSPWHCDIHTDINVQMNYWPAEPLNLSELHLPLLNFIINMSASEPWKRAAALTGQSKGWNCFIETNAFGGMTRWSDHYCVANAWYCSHLWQHYRYTLDKDYLAKAFPAMWSATTYWMERLIPDRTLKDGTLVCPDEFSAEQSFIDNWKESSKEDATAHSQQLVYALLADTRAAIDELGSKATGLSRKEIRALDQCLERIDRGLHTEAFQADERWKKKAEETGVQDEELLLKEWKYSSFSRAADVDHRHLSHLTALYPLGQITPDSDFMGPAVNSLRLRGDESTGWSLGWKINLWARAQDGDHAHLLLKNALRHSNSYKVNFRNGGVYYNLFSSHSPFMIDGNFGACAAYAEMLMQSYQGFIDLLPALPSVWKDGEVNGLKAVGDFTVDIRWKDLRPEQVEIISNQGQALEIRHALIRQADVQILSADCKVSRPAKVKHTAPDRIRIKTHPGDRILLTF